MAVTITQVRRTRVGNMREVVVDVVGPASYTTGGETLTAAQQAYLFPELSPNILAADFTKCIFFEAEVMFATTPAFLSACIAKATNKFVFITAGAQTGNAVDLSAQTVRCRFWYMIGAAG